MAVDEGSVAISTSSVGVAERVVAARLGCQSTPFGVIDDLGASCS